MLGRGAGRCTHFRACCRHRRPSLRLPPAGAVRLPRSGQGRVQDVSFRSNAASCCAMTWPGHASIRAGVTSVRQFVH